MIRSWTWSSRSSREARLRSRPHAHLGILPPGLYWPLSFCSGYTDLRHATRWCASTGKVCNPRKWSTSVRGQPLYDKCRLYYSPPISSARCTVTSTSSVSFRWEGGVPTSCVVPSPLAEKRVCLPHFELLTSELVLAAILESATSHFPNPATDEERISTACPRN